jgi:hypothetical protein
MFLVSGDGDNVNPKSFRRIQTNQLQPRLLMRTNMGKFSAIILVILELFLYQISSVLGGNGEPFGEKGQKSYDEDEEGKIVPHR